MCPVVMVVADILGHESFEVSFVKDDDMIEQVSPAVANEAFCDAVLPRAAECSSFGSYAEALHRIHDFFIEVRSAVEYQIAGG